MAESLRAVARATPLVRRHAADETAYADGRPLIRTVGFTVADPGRRRAGVYA